MAASTYLLEMKGINKHFAGIPALQQVDFSVKGGQIHALLGANGAGKSTLMKILSGAYQHDSGSILSGGVALNLQSPADAKRQGIHCVYQEVDAALVPQLSVAENVLLDLLSARDQKLWLRPKSMAKEAQDILARLNVAIPVNRKVSELSLAEKQMVLLGRILAQDAKVIIFDEPTAPLSESESESFFRILHSLKDSGVACIFITHRLHEVLQHTDHVTVMRDGTNVYSQSTANTSTERIIQEMLGKTFAEEFPKANVPIGDVLLEAKWLKRGVKVRGVDLQVRSGEILAVVGLVGAGKTELARLLSGADRIEEGTLLVKNEVRSLKQPADAVAAGIVSVPEERRKQGILIHESVERNLSLPILDKLSTFSFVSRSKEKANALQVIEQLGIKTSSGKQGVEYLSGGNQQKVSIGKWLESEASVFVFDEPTKGVDIGAKSDIFRIIGTLAAAGKGIIYLTCELNEALGIGDRIAVMYDGQIIKEFRHGEATQEQLLFFASGGQED